MPTKTATIQWTLTDEAPRSPPIRCCRSSRPSPRLGRRRRDPGHLAGRPHHRQLPREPDARAADSGRPRLARRAHAEARGQHHQAAEHLRLGPAAKAAIKELQAQGYEHPGLPGEPEGRRREGAQGALRQGARQRRQPGAARGQLRPPRAALGEGFRQEAPAQAGRLEPGLEDPRRAHEQPATSTAARSPSPSPRPTRRAHRVRRRRRHGHRAQGEDCACWRAKSSTPR